MLRDDPISRIRRFNRAVTVAVGALDDSFLGRGRSLGAARVLNAVGRGYDDVGGLRAELGLDSGLASRLLRGLEAEGMLRTVADATDARRRRIVLTQAGRREYAAYEALSDQQAEDLLARCGDRAALLSAMDCIVEALSADPVTIAVADPAAEAARACLAGYYDELARRFDGGFDVARSRDPDLPDISPPRGAFFVASSAGRPLGCVALRRTGSDRAEIKRLWVAPEARGRGLARRLMAAAEQKGAELGLSILRLDTNRALPEAIALYEADGWVEIPRFNDDPYADRFFEKPLKRSDA